jgi:hypothetical protein
VDGHPHHRLDRIQGLDGKECLLNWQGVPLPHLRCA